MHFKSLNQFLNCIQNRGMKAEQRLRLRKALHDDYKRGVQYKDALARLHQQHGKKAVTRITVASWWKQFSNGEAPITLPRNSRSAIGQLSDSSIELRAATQRTDFVIPSRYANRYSINVSSRALDGRFVYFNNYEDHNVKNIWMVDLLYSQTRFAFQNKSCLHFAAKKFLEFSTSKISTRNLAGKWVLCRLRSHLSTHQRSSLPMVLRDSFGPSALHSHASTSTQTTSTFYSS